MTGYNIKKVKIIKEPFIITLAMRKSMIEWIDKQGSNRSEVIRGIIKKAMDKDNQ